MNEIVLSRVREFAAAGYRLNGRCPRCQRFVEVSMARLVMLGKGDKHVRDLRIRHACGAQVELRIAPPDRSWGESNAAGPAIRLELALQQRAPVLPLQKELARRK